MGLVARSNKQGSFTYTSDVEYWRQSFNGDTTYPRDRWAWLTLVDHKCRKAGMSNAYTTIPGTTTRWRPPSTYARGVTEHTWGKEVWFYRDGTFSQISDMGFPDDPSRSRQVPWRFDWGGPYNTGSEELESQAIAKALERIKDQKMGMGENLGQCRQTVDMIVDAGRTLLDAAIAVKRGNMRGAWELLKDSRSVVRRGSDLFLQYKYGWKPLMSDIYGLRDLLEEQMKPALLVTGSAKSPRQAINIRPNPGEFSNGSGYQQSYVKLYGKINDRPRRVVEQIGLANPLRLAWDFVPFSFVVDWFAPVGTMLDGLLPPAGLDFVGGFVTARCELQIESEMRPWGTWQGDPVRNTHKGFAFDRRKFDNWPRPSLYFIQDPFNLSHGLSAIALALQKLTR